MRLLEIAMPAPILNTPDFSAVFGGATGVEIPLDDKGHPFHFEFVALPGMKFTVEEEIGPFIVKVLWEKYSTEPLYLDRRFCGTGRPLDKSPSILNHMENRIGTPYVWGGNWADGIPEMLEFYPPKGKLDRRTEELWTLRGLDCSGLLFEATRGATPRNTSQLIQCGRSLEENEALKPLDMIIYPGHVLFVRDSQTIIESKSPFGVRICPLEQRLDEISRERTLIREWYPSLDKSAYYTIRRYCTFDS